VHYLTTEQMVEVDRAMTEDFRIELMQMMENAGRNLAHLARKRFLDGDPRDKRIVVLAGPGGNGGGALVCARRLQNWGAVVRVLLSASADRFSSVPAQQLEILTRMNVKIADAHAVTTVERPQLVVDGIIGYSLKGAPRGEARALIEWANGCATPILSLDVPSGVDATTGKAYEPAVRATATMTLALPKEGLRVSSVEGLVGELYLADISVPPVLYAGPGLGLEIGPLFAREDVIRVH